MYNIISKLPIAHITYFTTTAPNYYSIRNKNIDQSGALTIHKKKEFVHHHALIWHLRRCSHLIQLCLCLFAFLFNCLSLFLYHVKHFPIIFPMPLSLVFSSCFSFRTKIYNFIDQTNNNLFRCLQLHRAKLTHIH